MMLRVSINRQYQGKPPENVLESDETFWRRFNGGFKNHIITISQFMREVSQGHAFSTMVKGYRKKTNFICGQHIGLDFDTEDYQSSFKGLMENEYIAKYAHFMYSTPSSTPDAPRTRVVFILPEPVYNNEEYTDLAKYTVKSFGVNDTKCNDPCRIFYGSRDCEFNYIGNFLPVNVAKELFVEPAKEQERLAIEQHMKNMALANQSGYSANGYDTATAIQRLVDKFNSAPDGEKHGTLCQVAYTAGGYIGGGMDEQLVVREIGQAIHSHPTISDRGAAYRTLMQCIQRGKSSPLEIPIYEPFARNLGINIKGIS